MNDTLIARTAQEAAQLAQELERRRQTARDYVVDNQDLSVSYQPEQPGPLPQQAPGLHIFHREGLLRGLTTSISIAKTARQQLYGKTNVPGDYGERLWDRYPELWTETINTLKPDGRSLVRTLDGSTRAVLSDRYRVLDNYDLFFSTFSVAQEVGAEVSRATLTDDTFELRLIVPDWRERIEYQRDDLRERAAGQGGYLHEPGLRHTGGSDFIPGIYVRNSETGRGGLSVSPFIYDLVCSNGLITESALRQIHLGGKLDAGALSQESVEADSKAIWLRVRDLTRAVFNRDKFRDAVASYVATGVLTLDNPVAAVDLLVKNSGLNDDDRQSILNELISPSHGRNAGASVLGLLNAITQRAQVYEVEDPEKATSLEALAGALIEPSANLVYVRAN